MIIRPLEAQDLTRLAELGSEFYAEAGMPGSFIPAVFTAAWEGFFAADIGVIFAIEEKKEFLGALGAVITPDPNDGLQIATEFFWFVTKKARGNGLKLLNAFEDWAKERGAVRMTMVHLSNLAPDTLKNLYLRRGYREIETHYIKTI